MEGQASVSAEVLARYAADAARDVEGVRSLVESHLPRHRGVRVTGAETLPTVALHLEVDWGAQIPELGRAVQRRVVEYLDGMAAARPAAVNVLVDAIGPPP